MQRYIKENNSQIIYPNDCLNMQPVETPQHIVLNLLWWYRQCLVKKVMIIYLMLLIVDGKYPSFDKVSDNLDQYLTKCTKKLVKLVAETEKEVEFVDCDKFEKKNRSTNCNAKSQIYWVPRSSCKFWKIIWSLHYSRCLWYRNWYYWLFRWIAYRLLRTNCVFLYFEISSIFTGEKATRKYIHDVLVPECFTFAVMKILCVSNAVASNIRHIGFSVQQVNQLCAKFKRD